MNKETIQLQKMFDKFERLGFNKNEVTHALVDYFDIEPGMI